jgi:hypothetical protein
VSVAQINLGPTLLVITFSVSYTREAAYSSVQKCVLVFAPNNIFCIPLIYLLTWAQNTELVAANPLSILARLYIPETTTAFSPSLEQRTRGVEEKDLSESGHVLSIGYVDNVIYATLGLAATTKPQCQ